MAKTLTIQMKKDKLEKELMKLDIYEVVRESVVDKMQWDAMEYHPTDEEHDTNWFTAPEPDSYKYSKYQMYEVILSELDDFFLGK